MKLLLNLSMLVAALVIGCSESIQSIARIGTTGALIAIDATENQTNDVRDIGVLFADASGGGEVRFDELRLQILALLETRSVFNERDEALILLALNEIIVAVEDRLKPLSDDVKAQESMTLIHSASTGVIQGCDLYLLVRPD